MYQKRAPFELRKTAYITIQGYPRQNEQRPRLASKACLSMVFRNFPLFVGMNGGDGASPSIITEKAKWIGWAKQVLYLPWSQFSLIVFIKNISPIKTFRFSAIFNSLKYSICAYAHVLCRLMQPLISID